MVKSTTVLATVVIMIGLFSRRVKGEDYLIAVVRDLGHSTVKTVIGDTKATIQIQDTVYSGNVPYTKTFHEINNTLRTTLGIEKKSIIVRTSDDNVKVYGLTGIDQFSVLPVPALGNRYIATSCLLSSSFTSVLVIAALQKTTIYMTLKLSGNLIYNNRTYRSGYDITFDLEENETVTLKTNSDLSGTVMSSTQNVAVFTGSIYTDYVVAYEQLLPFKHYGKEYVISVNAQPYTMHVASDYDDTAIHFNNGSVVSVDESGIYVGSMPISGSISFTTTRPVQTLLCLRSFPESGLMMVPPVSLYTTKTAVYDQSTIQILTGRKTTSVLVQSASLSSDLVQCSWKEIQGTKYKVGTCRPPGEPVFISSKSNFTVLAFGLIYILNGGYHISKEDSTTQFEDEDFLVPSVINTEPFRVSISTGEKRGWIKAAVTNGTEWILRQYLLRRPFTVFITKLEDVIAVAKGTKTQSVLVGVSSISMGVFAFSTNAYFSPLPVSTLGTKYIVSSFLPPINHTAVLVVATHSKKSYISIQFQVNAAVSYDGKSYNAGDVLNVSLQEYETLTMDTHSDLTGTTVTSTQTVAVFSGMKTQGKLVSFMQLMPCNLFRQEFVVTAVSVDGKSQETQLQLQIISEHKSTQIQFNNGSTVYVRDTGIYGGSMQDGEVIQFTTTRPVMATVFRKYVNYISCLVVPPVSFYRTQTNLGISFVTHIFTSKDASDVSVRDEFAEDWPVTWEPIPGSRYKVGTLGIRVGNRAYIKSNTKFGVLVYHNAFALNGGYNFSSEQGSVSDIQCPPAIDYRSSFWPTTKADVIAKIICPVAYTGVAKRTCSSNGTWEEARYNECVNMEIQYIVNKITPLNETITSDDLLFVIVELANATERHSIKLTSGDIVTVVNSLPILVRMDNQTRAGLNVTEAFVSVVSNLVSESTKREWTSLQEETHSRTFTILLDAVTDAGFVAAEKVDQDGKAAVVVRENIVFEAGKVSPKDIAFPNVDQTKGERSQEKVNGLDCRNAVSTTLRKATLENIENTKGVHSYTAALYNTLGYLHDSEEPDEEGMFNISPSVPTVSMYVGSNREIYLDPPLEVTYRACVTRRKTKEDSNTEPLQVDPPLHCLRKEKRGDKFVWTSDGCEVVTSNKNKTECKCSKTGHFASSFKKFLTLLVEFLEKYACIFPIVAVILKLLKGIYNKCNQPKQRTSKVSDQPVRKLVIALIVSLIIIISNVELIAAVQRTDNREECWIIAATLHFFFLIECFYFMVQAVDIFLPASLSIAWFILLIGLPWVLSATLVTVPMFVLYSREEYLGEKICWLSKESGSYLFLIIPAAFVPLIQLFAFVKTSREKPCGCKGETDKSACQKMTSWISDHRQLLEFAAGIALMSAQVFLSVFAEDDEGVMNVFFGISTLLKGLLLAIAGLSSEGDETPKDNKNEQEFTNMAETKAGDTYIQGNKMQLGVFDNPAYSRPDDLQDGINRLTKTI